MTTRSETSAVTVKLRREIFNKVCAERGLNTIAAVAKTIGLSERQVDRVVNDGDDPSGRFIGRALAAWPLLSFRALFAVVDETTGEEMR
jgi:predicted DNA-binding transcriptional regulator AlpA